MTLQGSWLTHPLQVDQRGMLATTAKRDEMVEQSIAAILETRQGERVMVPDYGIPDFVFAVMDAGFAARLAYFLDLQIRNYEPMVGTVRATAGALKDGDFVPGVFEDQQRAAVAIEFTARGSNTPRNLVYPVWRLRQILGEAA